MEFPFCSFIVVLSCINWCTLTQAQDQSGFISLACGAPKDASYTDSDTNITYISDAAYVETGEERSLLESMKPSFYKKYWHVRSFPNGDRNCYTLKVSKGGKYFIKGNGVNRYEVLHRMESNTCFVCLVKNGSTTPRINTLELRPADTDSYNHGNGSLGRFLRWNYGSTSSRVMRFSEDPLDREWRPLNFNRWNRMNTSESVNSDGVYRLPQSIMQTASVPVDVDEPMLLAMLTPTDEIRHFALYFHVAELQRLKSNESREVEVVFNDQIVYGPFSPQYLNATTIYLNTSSVQPNSEGNYVISIRKSSRSTLPPLLNAMEIYHVLPFPELGTKETEVKALFDIKRAYGVQKISWQGDPCAPIAYMWEGLNCSYSGYGGPSIKSLNLSSSGLRGEVAHSISRLRGLTTLDLSNNRLNGSMPEFLAEMPELTFVNLRGNNLSGSMPRSLLRKAEAGSLSLCVDGLDKFCSDKQRQTKKSSYVVPVIIAMASALITGTLLAAFFLVRRRRRKALNNGSRTPIVGTRDRRLKYSNIERMTNNFERVIGRGSFGVVYHGVMEGNDVAVKLITRGSIYAYQQFKAEVELLVRVHHKNLTRLIGYCEGRNAFGLVYEYMENGDLKQHLSGARRTHVLSWKARLEIAIDAAQGLEYLHHGCRPPIIHRDVKTSNILLNKDFKAKLSDFGLSRSYKTESETHVSTVVAGTPGYLDPEYHQTAWLTEKSDVYSFGIVLLEIVTNRPVIDKIRNEPLISKWAIEVLNGGDIAIIVDPELLGDFDKASVWRAVDIAMSCASPIDLERPKMSEVVAELNESLKLEALRNPRNNLQQNNVGSSIDVPVIEASFELTPLPR